jgi:hypothetical protein
MIRLWGTPSGVFQGEVSVDSARREVLSEPSRFGLFARATDGSGLHDRPIDAGADDVRLCECRQLAVRAGAIERAQARAAVILGSVVRSRLTARASF